MPRQLVYSVHLLLFFLFLRLSNVLSFPSFIDEHEHIQWARDVYRAHFFAGANTGRLFGLWWMALFGLQQDTSLFLARVSTALFSLVTAAVLFDLGRRLIDTRAGGLAVLLYAIAPYTFFYERMGLTDTYVTVWSLLAAWFAFRYTWRLKPADAVCCGLALVLAFLAKATGITVAVIPLLIMILPTPQLSWRQRVHGLLISLGTFAAGVAVAWTFLKWRGYDYLSAATTLVGTDDTSSLFERLGSGLVAVWKISIDYFSLPFLVLAGLFAVYLLIRRREIALFLIGATLIPLASLLAFALKHSARYFHFSVPFVLLLVAIGLVQLSCDLSRRSRAASIAVLIVPPLLWGFLFVVPFYRTYFGDPAMLALPQLDRMEYIVADSSGFALPEVADYLKSQAEDQPIVVVGLIANCGVLDYYVPDSQPIRLICPLLKWDGSHQPEVIALVNQLAVEREPLWVVFERSTYIDLEGITLSFVRQATFQRPQQLTLIEVLRVSDS